MDLQSDYCMADAKIYVTDGYMRNLGYHDRIYRYNPFRGYYQIGTEDKPAGADEPTTEKELKGHMEPSHSLFGIIGQICFETGWSVDYLMNGINYVMLTMMLADSPHWVPGKEKSITHQPNTNNKARLNNAADFEKYLKEHPIHASSKARNINGESD